ncbi:ComEC/Rec2 family competence protein [Runella limosa]|uniref:ComEC/Rec2 family competence protein n=1 Tax=Runella limosa TaxID=370978 RepID=UPI000491C605|nr:ComEC/Rec2 family competence protein [Runella limosa]
MNPLLRVTIAFIIGILVQHQWPLPTTMLWALGTLLVVLWFIGLTRLANRYLLGITTFGVFIYLGGLAVTLKNESLAPTHLVNFRLDSIQAYRGQVIAFPETRGKTHRAVLEITHVKLNHHWQEATGKIQAYIDKKAPRPAYGAELVVLGAPQLVAPPLNPNQFDFRQFLAYKQIHHQHYLRATAFATTGKNFAQWYSRWPYQLSQWSDDALKKLVPIEREYAVAKAMILGLRDDMDTELVQAYSAAGAVHVLSVSGFHIGVFVAIIAFLLQKLRSHRRGRWLYVTLTLGILWFYAILTGLSAPVVRSALMFSLFLLAEPLGKKSNGENALFGSALILLAYDPLLVFSVSFQLSYAALAGIIFWQPTIYQWITAKNWFLDKLWAITAVALAAQLATYPLSVYYFHQFPTYFLVANPLVVALSTAMIPVALAALALSAVPFVESVIGWILTGITWLLNQSVVWIEQLPSATLTGITFGKLEVVIVYAIIGILAYCWYQKEVFLVKVALAMSAILVVVQGIHLYENNTQKLLIVHDIPKQTVVSLIEGTRAILVADSLFFASNQQPFSFYLKNFYDVHGIREITNISLDKATNSGMVRPLPFGKLIVWKGQELIIAERPISTLTAHFTSPIIVRKGAIKSIQKNAYFEQIPLIFDSSVSTYYLKSLAQKSPSSLHSWYFTFQKGAYIRKI